MRRSVTFPNRMFTLVAVAVIASSMGVGSAAAGTEEPFLTVDDVLPGSCSPETAIDGQIVDCRFPLSRAAPLDPWFGPHVADQNIEFDDVNDDQADCVIEGMELVCRGLNTYYNLGGRSVRVMISGELSPVLATFESVDWSPHGMNFTPTYGEEPYVFEGSELEVWLESSIDADEAFAVVTERDGGGPLLTASVGPVERHAYRIINIDVSSLPQGRYRVTPCVGAAAESCTPVPGGQVFQIGTDELIEVIPGWNRPGADRINLVFAPSGFGSVEEALEMARLLLAWDGPLAIGYDWLPVADPSQAELVSTIGFGPFAIEPLDSARHRFNLWLLDGMVEDPLVMMHSAPPFGFGPPLPDFGLPDVSVTTIHLNPLGRFSRSQAGWTSFTSPDGPTVVSRDGLEFAGTYLALPRNSALSEAATLAHEWGHALFDLRDEYVEPEFGVTHGYPNCAPDQATAEAWWGGMVGDIDPFVYEYVAALERYSVWVDPFIADRVAVGYEVGGCYSGGDDVVRPTVDSLMNSTEMPVFGSVNRARVEEILGLWTGRDTLSDPSDLLLSCDPVGGGSPAAVCGASVASMVDIPEEGLVLAVDGVSVACRVVAGGGPVATVVECPQLVLEGRGPWSVSLGTASGSVTVQTQIASPPVPTTTTIEVEPEPPPTHPALPVWPLVAGGMGLLGLIVFTTVRRVRRVTPLG